MESLLKKPIVSLNLRDNRFGEQQIEGVLNLIRNSSTLKHLDMTFCALDEQKTKEIMEALKENKRKTSFESLKFSNNKFGVEGTPALISYI